MAINVNFEGLGYSVAPDIYLEMGGNDANPFQTILGMKTFGLDDFEDVLFTPSAESLGFPGLESSGSTTNMDSILDLEDGWSLKSHPCSSQPSYRLTSLPEGNLGHLSSAENYAPATDYTCTSNKNMQNPRSTFQTLEPTSAQCNIATEDIARDCKRKCSSMLITFGQNEVHSSDEVTNIVDERDQASRPDMSSTSKNLVAERKRRKKVNELFVSLRALLPNISKIGKASIIDEAVDYIQSLQKKIKETGDDISGLRSASTLQCSRSSTSELIISSSSREPEELDNYENRPTESHDRQGFKIMQLDVTKVEAKTFLIQISCKKETGIIIHLIRALASLELVIINANHLTLNVCTLSTVLVEVEKWESVQESRIKKIIVDAVSNYGFEAV